ncbi:NTE family protein [Streptomyces puniciscabiei]|uniref:NTE family protein n=1 Tax=Streptomyces puniciscabiei TaxID=164348 RepID=A0A542SXI2_9ACTN|nr:patatin-like phospholipase family protein [Streptomyces puniciscabiei]TQK79330.1 NTE family protein [Streptomyces puniciscabiei]
MSQESTAVVLGGGGLAGIGWTIGVLAALEEAGALRLASAAHVIGTSAGAAVAAAVLQSGAAAEFDRTVRKARRNEEIAPAVALADILPDVLAVHGTDESLAAKTAKLAALSRERSGTDPARRREVIAGRLHKDAWPDARLSVTAVRADGEATVFTADSGVSLVDALTASCAVPGLWPVATIDGHDYVDGGTYSLTNADLAAHADRVLVVRPQPDLPGYVTPERQRVLDRALLLEPSERSRAGFGSDPFDPDVRGVAAVLGYEDGLAAVPAVTSLTGA